MEITIDKLKSIILEELEKIEELEKVEEIHGARIPLSPGLARAPAPAPAPAPESLQPGVKDLDALFDALKFGAEDITLELSDLERKQLGKLLADYLGG